MSDAKAKEKKEEESPEPAKGTSWLSIVVVGVLIVGAAALSVGGAHFADAGLRQFVANRAESRLRIEDIAVSAPPAWLAADYSRNLVKAAADGLESVSLADHDLARRLGANLEHNAWVEKATVRTGYRRMEIDIRYRKPVLFVPWEGKGCYVDESAVVLPGFEANADILRGCLVVEGVRQSSLPAVGVRFDDPIAIAAAGLAGVLAPAKARLDLLVIVVRTPTENRAEWELKTRKGSRIMWASLPTNPSSADESAANRSPFGGLLVGAAEKLKRLDSYFDRFGSLDLPDGPNRFNLLDGEDAGPVPLSRQRR